MRSPSSSPPHLQHHCTHDDARRDLLYLDLALEGVVRAAAERGTGAAGRGASSLVGPLLQNLVLSTGNNEELCYCLKAWQDLPAPARGGQYPSKETALKVCWPLMRACVRVCMCVDLVHMCARVLDSGILWREHQQDQLLGCRVASPQLALPSMHCCSSHAVLIRADSRRQCPKQAFHCHWQGWNADAAGLQAAAVVDRIRRAVASTADAQNARLVPIAVPFGKAFGVEDW